jgi:hypothetical protein
MKPPSTVVTVIVTVPAATAVTRPSSDTEANSSFELLQVTLLLVAVVGATVAINCAVLPTRSVKVDLFKAT